MTLQDIKHKFRQRLAPLYGEGEALSIFYLVAEDMWGISRQVAMTGTSEKVAADNLAVERILAELVAMKPVQYVTGIAEFCGLTFGVSGGVLIPRPETEELVMLVEADMRDMGRVRILDIGTGSGAIAVSLASRLRHAELSAVDVSCEALSIARDNARRNGVDVDFRLWNVLAEESPCEGLFDVIVSNPPYIPASERGAMNINVTEYEPPLALFVDDDDPLLFYRTIAEKCRPMLRSRGRLYFEIHERFGEETCLLLFGEGYSDVEIFEDIHSKPRMIRCVRP